MDDGPKKGFHLQGIDLDIKKGELVALIGSYGSGKTSLVNCILGEMRR
ncbi:MAG: ATP-binding cassette domain-containing protein [Bdellovibrionales bacterium]|nr:ATP-binding cassette domain-containing protein [Bdellovibrionales bacterium]